MSVQKPRHSLAFCSYCCLSLHQHCLIASQNVGFKVIGKYLICPSTLKCEEMMCSLSELVKYGCELVGIVIAACSLSKCTSWRELLCTYDNHMPTQKWYPISSMNTHTSVYHQRRWCQEREKTQCSLTGVDGDLCHRVLWWCYHTLSTAFLSYTSGLWGSTPIRRVVLTLGEKKNQ